MSWLVTPAEKTPVDKQGIANVSLLLHGNGTNGSTTITDSSPTPKTVSAVGNAQISTAIADPFGSSTGVIAFDGSGDYLSISNSSTFSIGLSNQPYTVEFFFYRNSTGDHMFVSKGGGYPGWGQADGYDYAAFVASSVIYWMWNDNLDPTPVSISSATLPAIQQWHHYAATYDGTTTRFFINGTSIGTPLTSPYASNSAANRVRVGASPVDADLLSLNGYIDDLRITKGVARYTANFTPPTAPFPNI
jgi:hypothetical protein